MDVRTIKDFVAKLDIFGDDREDPDLNLKTTSAMIIAICLMFFPASALRWDGSIQSPLEKEKLTKLEQVRLEPNAILNQTLRILATVAGLGLTGYAARLDWKDLEKEPLRVRKREAQDILTVHHLNSKLLEILPPDPEETEDKKTLAPGADFQSMLQAYVKGGNVEGEAFETMAAKKFTVSGKAEKSATIVEGMQSRNIQINQAIAVATKPVLEGEAINSDRWEPFKIIGKNILDGMTITEKSVLIASGTGTGKTTTEQHLLQGLIANYPTTTFYALLQKNDQLIGVKAENIYVFDNELLNRYLNQPKSESEEGEERIVLFDILAPLFIVYQEFYRRKQLSATERDRLKETAPMRLILGDWFATFQELSRLEKKDRDQVMSMIRQIITVARDCGVGLIVDSQSAALASLGLAEDASIRESLDIYSQGFVRKVNGQEKGEVNTMRQIIRNDAMVSKEDREGLMRAYLLLTNEIQKGGISSPIIFTTVGSVPTIGIVPDLSNMTVRHNEKPGVATVIESVVEINMLPQVFAQEYQKRSVDCIENQKVGYEEEIKIFHETVYSIIAKAVQPCSFEAIRTSRVWAKERPKSAEIREALDVLISQEKIEGDEDDGYVT